MRAVLDRKDVITVLPTGCGKSLIYQMFVRAKDYQMNGEATILVISPLVGIINKHQTSINQSINQSSNQSINQSITLFTRVSAVDISELTVSEIRQCNFKVIFASVTPKVCLRVLRM